MNPILWSPIIAVVLLAALIDVWCRRIPNWLTLPSLVLGVGINGALYGFAGLSRGLGGVATAVALMGGLCLIGSMGMGDLKLAASVGAWTGAPALLLALLITAMTGGVIAVAYAIWKRKLGATLDNAASLLNWPSGNPPARITDPDALTIPYAPAIAIGVIVSYFAN